MAPSRTWLGVVSLMIILAVAYMDRINVSILIADGKFLHAFGLAGDRGGQGRLMTLFLLGYGLSAWFVTPLFEARLSVRAGLLVSLALWTLLTGASAMTSSGGESLTRGFWLLVGSQSLTVVGGFWLLWRLSRRPAFGGVRRGTGARRSRRRDAGRKLARSAFQQLRRLRKTQRGALFASCPDLFRASTPARAEPVGYLQLETALENVPSLRRVDARNKSGHDGERSWLPKASRQFQFFVEDSRDYWR